MAKRPSSRKAAASRRRSSAGPNLARSRPVWTGQLRLALVTVPVQLYSAIKSGSRISFHQVHGPSGKRVRHEKVVPGIGPIDSDEILKGYELSDGNYVLLEKDEVDAVKIEASRIFDLVQFVDHCEIDPIYFDRPYYVAPDGELAEEAYAVFREALRRSKKMGLGQIVMRGQEYVAALKPCGDGLLLETLRYADEVREAAPIFADIADEKPAPELLDLATELIERKAAPFDPSVFEDRYSEALKDLIEAKVQKRATVTVGEEEQPQGAKVIDLVEALKQSVRRNEQREAQGKSQNKAQNKSQNKSQKKPAAAKPTRKAG